MESDVSFLILFISWLNLISSTSNTSQLEKNIIDENNEAFSDAHGGKSLPTKLYIATPDRIRTP